MQKIKELLDNNYKNDILSSLKKEYKEAYQDIKFKALVDELKINEQVLMKYTSLLEESANEYHNCQKCKNIMECKNTIQGYAYLPQLNNNKLDFSYRTCRHQEKLLNENSHIDNIALYNTPKDITQAKMKYIHPDEYRLDVIKWIKNFLTKYPKTEKGLYLHGNFGCGKTYIISAAFNELAKKNIKSAIVFWPEYIRDLKSSFGIDFNNKFNYIKTVPLLLIDDLGAENLTNWSRDEILCPILQYRMEEKIPTFFTSNLDLKALEQHLSMTSTGVEIVKARRIIERIKQLTDEQKMIGTNYRK